MRQVNAEAWNKSASFAATKAWWRSLVSADFYTCFFFVHNCGIFHCRVDTRPPSLANNISSVWLDWTGTGNPVGSKLPSQDINRNVIGCHAYADHGADSLIWGKCLVERR